MRGFSGVGLSSIVAAASGYLILFLAARTLSPEDNAEFLTFWATLFFVFGVLSGIINESTRAVRARVVSGSGTPGARILPAGLLIGTGAAVIIAATSPLWGRALFPHQTGFLVAGICVAAVAYAGHAAMAGAAGGLQHWNLFARLAILEALVRLGAAAAVAFLAASLFSLELACAAGALAWLALYALSPSLRRTATARADVALRPLLRQSGHAMTSAAATATLITGYPILLKFTTEPSVYAFAAPLILAISITRAPIMMPLQAFQSVLISSLVDSRSGGPLRKLYKPVGLILAGGMLAAGLAAWLGPAIMLIFGPDYRVAAAVMGGLTFSAALMAVLTLTGTVCLAANAHRSYALGWIVATVASFALLFLPWPLETRVVLSLMAGPVAGTIVHLSAIAARARGAQSAPYDHQD